MKKILFVVFSVFLFLSCTDKKIGGNQVVELANNYVEGSIDLAKAAVVYDENDWAVVNNSV